MNLEDKRDVLQPDDTSSTDAGPEQEIAEFSEPRSAEEAPSNPPKGEPEAVGATEQEAAANHEEPKTLGAPQFEHSATAVIAEQQTQADEMSSSPSVVREQQPPETTPSVVAESAPVPKVESFFRERPPQRIEVAPHVLRHWTRRDVLLFGAGAIAALAGGGSLLPQATLERLGVIHGNKNWPRKEWFLKQWRSKP